MSSDLAALGGLIIFLGLLAVVAVALYRWVRDGDDRGE